MRLFYFILFLFLSANGFAEEENSYNEDLSFDKGYTEKGITLGTQGTGFELEPNALKSSYSEYAVLQITLGSFHVPVDYSNDLALIDKTFMRYTHFNHHLIDESHPA